MVRSNMPDAAEGELSGWRDPLARLRAALQHDEFSVVCQPIAALAKPGSYPMAEVLVRLREEERALLPPGDFLPVFEHYHMMPELDRWIVRQVVNRLASGSRMGCFSVNIAAQTVEDATFPDFVAAELGAARVPPDAMLLEVDELDTLNRLPAVQRLAAALQPVGVGVVIDGFGRKSVSFHALKLLPVRHVKVDGAIVRKLLQSGIARTKLNAVLRVAETTGMGVIAECVEEPEVLAQLKALGVPYAQGFGIAPPQPIESFAAA